MTSIDEDGRLVVGPFPVRIGDRGNPPRPDRAMVFSLSDGIAELVTRRPSVRESRRYRYRYEIDVSDKHLAWHDTLPSSVAGYFFRAELEMTWRVSSAVDVVRRGITTTEKGDAVVRRGLTAMLISRTRKFDIEDYADAQQALNSDFGSTEYPLPEGIMLSAFTARLNLDADAEQYVRARHRMDWDAVLAEKQHAHDMNTAQQKGEVTVLVEEQLRGAAQREGGLILYVMAQDPSQLRSVLNEIAAHQQITLEQKQQLFSELIANKLVQPADVDVIWQTLFQQPQSFGFGPGLRALQQGPGPKQTDPASTPDMDPSAATASAQEPTAPQAPDTQPAVIVPSGPNPRDAIPAQGAVGGVSGWKPVGQQHRHDTAENDAGHAHDAGVRRDADDT